MHHCLYLISSLVTTMSKLAVSAAYLCAFSYNCLDATVAYLINVGHIPLFEIICFRNVSTLTITRQHTLCWIFLVDRFHGIPTIPSPSRRSRHLLGATFGSQMDLAEGCRILSWPHHGFPWATISIDLGACGGLLFRPIRHSSHVSHLRWRAIRTVPSHQLP